MKFAALPFIIYQNLMVEGPKITQVKDTLDQYFSCKELKSTHVGYT